MGCVGRPGPRARAEKRWVSLLPFQSLQSLLGAITPNLGASISLDTENSHYGTPSSCPAHTAPTPQTAHKGKFYELVCLFRKQKSVTYLKAPSYCSQHLSPTPLYALAPGAENLNLSLSPLSLCMSSGSSSTKAFLLPWARARRGLKGAQAGHSKSGRWS